MRFTTAALVLLLVGSVAAVPSTTIAKQAATATQQALPPLSYVCPMAGDEDVNEEKPGACPKCNMTMVPVRLDAKYSCPVHATQEVKDGPGTCRFDGRELVPVTLSVFWTCAGDETHLMEPGSCANGQPRRVGYEVRAHGDHNPRHGGQFFMAQDAWHHIEGTLQPGNMFRMFFYDNFTKPLPVKSFQARVVTREEWDPVAKKTKELETFALKSGRDASTMEASLENVALPLKVSAIVKFGDKSPEQRFDFNFDGFSKEPVAPPAPTTTSAAPASGAAVARSAPVSPATPPTATPPAAATTPAASPAPQAFPAPAAPPATVQQPSPAAPPVDLGVSALSPIPAALNAALDESALPTAMPELLAELSKRAVEVEQMVNEGNLGQVWLPAMGTKTVALALGSHVNTLPERQRAAATLAVKRVVTSAWELDAYGDMGNKQKMSEAFTRLSSAVADLKAAYAPSR
ncbi:MAG: hypothetical protein GEU82_16130 [Luteitalea sp.]|nr:hypothetical protein [Luteitalea sp.]